MTCPDEHLVAALLQGTLSDVERARMRQHLGECTPCRTRVRSPGVLATPITHTNLLGTPLYMPPEQLRAPRDVDARADVWALGTILFELLTGNPPFRRATLEETARAIEEAPVPSLGPELDPLLSRCLAKNPAARFADGNELLAFLERAR